MSKYEKYEADKGRRRHGDWSCGATRVPKQSATSTYSLTPRHRLGADVDSDVPGGALSIEYERLGTRGGSVIILTRIIISWRSQVPSRQGTHLACLRGWSPDIRLWQHPKCASSTITLSIVVVSGARAHTKIAEAYKGAATSRAAGGDTMYYSQRVLRSRTTGKRISASRRSCPCRSKQG